MEDEQIIELYWQRNQLAVKETAEKYGHYCLAIAERIIGKSGDAEECVNDTWLKAWESIPPNRPSKLSLYLGKIARNLAINRYEYLRAKKRYTEAEVILSELEACIPDTAWDKQMEGSEITQALNNFLYTLKEEQRVVFVRRYFYSESIRQIAEQLRISESKVNSMLHRTRKLCKTFLEKEGIWI